MRVPAVTPAQMAEIDRRVIEDYHIDLLMMIENAGRALAVQARRMLGGSVEGWRILVLAGKGNNGGGGLVSARHLHNWGANVEVVLSDARSELKKATAIQLAILLSLGMSVPYDVEMRDFEILIDALLGYNQKGDPRGTIAELVEEANSSQQPTIALDIPTGLDPLTGHPNQPCIRATQTLTLALPKTGLLTSEAKGYVGELFLADISVPPEIYSEFTQNPKPLFASDTIIRIEA